MSLIILMALMSVQRKRVEKRIPRELSTTSQGRMICLPKKSKISPMTNTLTRTLLHLTKKNTFLMSRRKTMFALRRMITFALRKKMEELPLKRKTMIFPLRTRAKS